MKLIIGLNHPKLIEDCYHQLIVITEETDNRLYGYIIGVDETTQLRSFHKNLENKVFKYININEESSILKLWNI